VILSQSSKQRRGLPSTTSFAHAKSLANHLAGRGTRESENSCLQQRANRKWSGRGSIWKILATQALGRAFRRAESTRPRARPGLGPRLGLAHLLIFLATFIHGAGAGARAAAMDTEDKLDNAGIVWATMKRKES